MVGGGEEVLEARGIGTRLTKEGTAAGMAVVAKNGEEEVVGELLMMKRKISRGKGTHVQEHVVTHAVRR